MTAAELNLELEIEHAVSCCEEAKGQLQKRLQEARRTGDLAEYSYETALIFLETAHANLGRVRAALQRVESLRHVS